MRGIAGISLRYKSSHTEWKRGETGTKAVIIEGLNPLVCIFCKFTTCIEFDLELHLYETHKMELVKLPIGKGSLDFRIEYTIKEGRRVGSVLHLLNENSKQTLGFEKA
jgi:hypothetical protein